MRRIIARVGPCKLKRYPRYFVTLCDSIISQQLSGRVAEVIFERFAGLYPRRRPTPQAVAPASWCDADCIPVCRREV